MDLHKALFGEDRQMKHAGEFKTGAANFVGISYGYYRIFSDPKDIFNDLCLLAGEGKAMMTGIQDLPADQSEEKLRLSARLIAHYHARFIQIHPFEDGNGRVSRMLAFEQMRVLLGHDYASGNVTDKENGPAAKQGRFASFSREEYIAALNVADRDLSHLMRCFVPDVASDGGVEPPYPIRYKHSHRPPGAP